MIDNFSNSELLEENNKQAVYYLAPPVLDIK